MFMCACGTILDKWNTILTNEEKLEQICSTSNIITSNAVKSLVNKNPEIVDPMLMVVSTIQVMFNTNDLAPDRIKEKIKQTLKEAKYNESTIVVINGVIDTALNLYSVVYTVNIESKYDDLSKSYIAILSSICDGIVLGCENIGKSPLNNGYKTISEYTLEELIFE